MYEEYLSEFFTAAPFIISFVAGVLSFLAPCVLPLVPAYVSYMSALSVSRLKQGEKLGIKEHIRLVLCAFLFVLGFSLVFIVMGLSVDLLIYRLFNHIAVKLAGAAVIIVFALHFMHIIHIRFLDYHKEVHIKTKIAFLAPFFLGISFAVGWTACVGPVLGAILTYSASGHQGYGTALMSLYALGLGVPFMLIAFLTSYAFEFLNRLKRYFLYIEILSGLLLMFLGVSLIYDVLYPYL
ncbi:MAG: cytochrome c biogenesis protein CcdA [Helicobacteraceae bacterium]|jgi:cytochrome c-type biogenesis protein|nr:cytochrome c biogenesis protein CcdA [Helicobacteraceae bacterium]